MNNSVQKLKQSLTTYGLLKTIYRVARYPINILRQKKYDLKIFKLQKIEDRFTVIYENNYWGHTDSLSGGGSSLFFTRSLRTQLPQVFKDLEIKTLLDSPCGDFIWMKEVLKENQLNYIGADIVKPLIESLKNQFEDENKKFIHLDLTKDSLPAADLMICRDCLFHLSYSDIQKVLKNFSQSDIPYLLTTTHKNDESFANKDIQTGDFRRIDLFAPPFNFPIDVRFKLDDSCPPHAPRYMCVWSKDQVAQLPFIR